MAVPSNRSPSPLSSRPILPHSRNSSDSITAARRSFSGSPFPRPSVLTNPRSLNPVTPANSPAGFGRRNSLGCDEKENEKDHNLKPVKSTKSPANGSKNFMSPTISAASKFTPSPRKKILADRNDPVRTSISLSEGKASFFFEISSEFKDDLATKSELSVDHQNGEGKDAVLEGPRASKSSKKVTFLEVPSDTENATDVKPETVAAVDSSSKNTPSSIPVSPIIAPLDADPLLPPYDPKTNYLSPRPQFLHYKPNPRIEVLLHKEKGIDLGEGKKLDDSFMLEVSESFSESDGTEGSRSEDSQKDSEDSFPAENVLPEAEVEEAQVREESTIIDSFMLEVSESFSESDGTEGSLSEDSQKDSEDSFPAENVLPEAEVEEAQVHEESTIIDPITDDSSEGIVEEKEEPRILNAPISHDLCEGVVEENDEAKTISPPNSYDISEGLVYYNIGKAKPRFFTKFKSVSVLLLLAIACFSVWGTDSPVMDSSSVLDILKSCKLPEPSQFAISAKAKFYGLGERFKQLSLDSISHLSLLINNLGRGHKLGSVKFMNLTDLQSDMSVWDSLDGLKQSQTFIRDLDEEDLEQDEVDESEHTFVEVFSDAIYEMESEESELGTEELPYAPAQLAVMDELESSETLWHQEEVSSHYEANRAPVSEASDVKSEPDLYKINHDSEVIESGNFEADVHLDSGAEIEYSSEDINHESTSNTFPAILEDTSSEAVEFPIGGSEEHKYSAYSVMGLVSLVLAVVSAAAAFVYLKQGNSSNPNPVVHAHGFSSKKTNPIPSVPLQERASFFLEEESCPSEMSSFERSSSYSRKDARVANEAQSQERKPKKYSKRESLASSSGFSTDSPSYGSFTTYERISNKHDNGDDEIITPVRRSSRLRNQVTLS